MMKPNCKTIALIFATIILALCSFACAPVNEAVLASTPEPTSTTTPTLSPTPKPPLSMEQKATMVWIGDDYQGCYPMEVFVFYGIINGKNRLIWSFLEDTQINLTYSLYEPYLVNTLSVYDLFNREYLFKLSFPQGSLDVTPREFYKYITDISPALKNATISSSDSLLNLQTQYEMEKVNTGEIQDAGALIMSYIYVDPNTIGPWSKKTALKAYCAVTPEDYILPYWDYVPDTVMPESLQSLNAFTSDPLPKLEYSQEQKESMTVNQPNREVLSIENLIVFFLRLNGNLRIILTVSYTNSKESDSNHVVKDYHDAINNEYLFSLRFSKEQFQNDVTTDNEWKYFFKSAAQLEGIKLLGSCFIIDLPNAFLEWDIPYAGNEMIDSSKLAFDKNDFSFLNESFTQDYITKLYLDTVPDAYLMPFWEYVPNAVTPEGFFTPSPEGSPTTAP